MPSNQTSQSSPIIIVGAGVFGLSTVLHLAEVGYSDVTVFDYQPYLENEYSTTDEVDTASADLNKVMRMSYGEDLSYQRLAFEAADVWKQWNDELAETLPTELPKGLTPEDRVFENCGFLRLSADEKLSQHETTTLANLTKEGMRESQYIIGDEKDEERARNSSERFDRKFNALRRKERCQNLAGVFDSTAGFVRASKACGQGCMASFIKGEDGLKVVGIKSADGVSHPAGLVVVAAGAWIPSLVPAARRLLEATAGSVAYIQLPQARRDLWTVFSPENFPVYSFGGWGTGARLGGFPRTESGIMKIGFREKKYTNYATLPSNDGVRSQRVSVPKTRYTPESETRITKEALSIIKKFVASNLPELAPLGISGVRNYWYTDSLDNDFVISQVPLQDGLFVCSGGNGHGFKFLPILGQEVVRIIESSDPAELNEYGKRWQWRDKKFGRRNGLEDGEAGPRVLSHATIADERDYSFEDLGFPRARL